MICREIGASQKPECPTARPQACPCNLKKTVTWMSIPAAKKVKHHGSVRAEGVKGGDRKAPLSPPQRRFPCYMKNQVTTEGFQRAITDFVCFHCPLVAPAGAIPPATKNTAPLAGESCCINKSTALLERPAVWSRSCARQYEAGRKSYLGGASADAQSYWQGCFAACAFVDFPFVMVTRGTVGALPQTLPEALSLDPARGRRKGTKSPLDPFLAPQLERFSLTGSSSTL